MLILDEAGMVGSADMAALLSEVKRAGAKLVLMGDPEQLQPSRRAARFAPWCSKPGHSNSIVNTRPKPALTGHMVDILVTAS